MNAPNQGNVATNLPAASAQSGGRLRELIKSKFSSLDMGRWKDFSDVLFNVAKILGVIAVGYWTVYQWNRTIFPKENFEEFKRRAELRTNLDISESEVGFSLPPDIAGNSKSVAVLYANGELHFKNDRSFPIHMALRSAEFTLAHPLLSIDTAPEQIKTGAIDAAPLAAWPARLSQDSDLRSESKGIIVEAGSSVVIPVSEFVAVNTANQPRFFAIGLRVEVLLVAVDPHTSRLVSETAKSKLLKFESLFQVEKDTAKNESKVVAMTDEHYEALGVRRLKKVRGKGRP